MDPEDAYDHQSLHAAPERTRLHNLSIQQQRHTGSHLTQ